MKKIIKKAIAILLVVLLVCTLPISAVTAYNSDETEYRTIKLDEEKIVTVDAEDRNEIFVFIPEETGYYNFYSYNSYFDTIAYLYDSEMSYLTEDDDSGDANNFLLSYYYTAGETYYLEAAPLGDDHIGTFSVQIVKPPKAESVEIENGDEMVGWVGVIGVLWAETYPEGSQYDSITWTSDNEDVVTVDDNGNLLCLSAGTATVTVTLDNGAFDTCKITVEEPLTLTKEQPVMIEINDKNDEKCAKFVPAETANLRIRTFDLSNDNTSRIIIYDADINHIGSSEKGFIDYEFIAGKTYYIITNYSETFDSVSGTYYLGVEDLVPATSICFDMGSEYTGYVNTSKYIDVIYSPENAIQEEFALESSDSEVVSVNAENNEIVFEKVGSAILTAKTESGLECSCTIDVLDYEDIELNEIKTVYLNGESEIYYYFTPEEDGYYSFYSSNNSYDTYGTIYDLEMNVITGDDDTGEDLNFDVRWNLEAGVTYILGSRFLNQDNVGTYDICIEKSKYITDMEIISMPEQTEFVEGNASNIDYQGLMLKLIWSNGTTTEWEYTEDWYINDDEYIELDESNLEETGEAVLSLGGASVILQFTIIENPVKYIELVSGTKYTYVENYNGHVVGELDESFFYYYTIWPNDAVIKIVYKNGESTTAYVGDEVDGYYINWEDNQYNKPWVVGSENESTISYFGHTVNLPITVKENKVESIEVVSGKLTVVENSYGFMMEEGDFYYYFDMPEDIVMKINYVDGTSKTALFTDEVDGQWFGTEDNQHEKPWILGDDNNLTISYLGKEAPLTVSVIPNPVDYIKINSAPTKEYIYGDSEYGYLYENGDYEFYPSDISGISFTVYYHDGTSKTFTDDDADEDGKINGYYYEFNFDYGTLSEVGDFAVEFTYMGKTAEYTVVLKESPVKSIEVTKSPDKTDYIEFYTPDFIGTEFTITYTDNKTKVVTLTEDNLVYDYNPDFGELLYEVDIDGFALSIEPYYDETNYYVVEYLGIRCEIKDIVFWPSKDINKIELDNVSQTGEGMSVNITYTDMTTENFKIDIVDMFDLGDNSIIAYSKTSNGILRYYIETEVDEKGKALRYKVEILGRTIIVEAPEVESGDTNNDGSIDNKDYALLMQYLNGWDVTIVAESADVNADGSIDNKDYALLMQYLNGWDVVLK